MNQQPDPPQSLPAKILANVKAINLYFIAVGAIGLVVLLIPLLSLRGTALPPELWTGWNVALGGLIAMIGARGNE
jgi:hypothetical protein